MNKISFWIRNSRSISLPQSLLPAFLAVAVSAQYADFSWWRALLAVFGVACVHLGMNLADDYFDYKQDTTRIRAQVSAEGTKTHTEKCHYILSGEATLAQLGHAIAAFLAVAAACGLAIFIGSSAAARWQIVVVAVLALLFGLSYSGGPLKLGYRGFGELTIGLLFGPLLMVGVSLAAGGAWGLDLLLVSVAVGLLVVNIVYVHSVMDVRADTLSGRITLAMLLKSDNAMIFALALFAFLPFLLVIAGVILGVMHWASLFVLVLVPTSIYLIYSAACFLQKKDIPLVPRWWMGPMGDFEKYRAADMDWFLMRWLVARNIVTFFCLILLLVYLLGNVLAF